MELRIKTLPVSDGEICVVSKGQRQTLAPFTGRIEIFEKQPLILSPMLEKGRKSLYGFLIVADDVNYRIEIDENTIHSGKVYEATAFVENEKLYFAGLIFRECNPISKELTFEIPDRGLVEKLIQ